MRRHQKEGVASINYGHHATVRTSLETYSFSSGPRTSRYGYKDRADQTAACSSRFFLLEELTQVHHACPKGRGSRASVQISHEHLGRRPVSKAFARLIVEKPCKRGQVTL